MRTKHELLAMGAAGLDDAAMLTLSASAHGLLKLLFNALLPDALEVSFEVFLMDVVQHAADGTTWTDELKMAKRLVFAEHSRIALGTVPDLVVGPADVTLDKAVELWCDKPAGHALEEKYFGSSVDAVELQAKRDRVRAEQEAQRRQRAQREAEAEAARKNRKFPAVAGVSRATSQMADDIGVATVLFSPHLAVAAVGAVAIDVIRGIFGGWW